MHFSRRLSLCRPRGPIILLALTLILVALTWRHFQSDASLADMHEMRISEYKDYFGVPRTGRDQPQVVVLNLTARTPAASPVVHHPAPNSSLYTSPEVFEERRKRWMRVCEKNPTLNGKVHGVFGHPSGVLYCFVPKAGCTFWKQVFNYASAKPQEKAKFANPWEYPRLLVHNNQMSKGRGFSSQDEKRFPMRVVVSRDPFSRVLSSYLDKFYLPDFWKVLGVKFATHRSDERVNNFFMAHFKEMDLMFFHTYGNKSHRECGSHLTFAQFLKNGLNVYEPHWLPVHSICNPCKLKPTHVVTMETFTPDARVIMKQMGLEHFLDGFDPVQQTDVEIDTIVKYNFDRVFNLASKKLFEGCVSQEELAYRLWNNFRWRGYIHPDFDYVIPQPGSNVIEDLGAQLTKAREAAIKDPAACKKFKSDFKIQAFKSLDKSLFETLVKKFEVDTELFGHEKIVEKMRALYS